MTDRKKPGWEFWTTIVLVTVLLGYPLTFGIWCSIAPQVGEGATSIVPVCFRPITLFAEAGEVPEMMVIRYVGLFAPAQCFLYRDRDFYTGDYRWVILDARGGMS